MDKNITPNIWASISNLSSVVTIGSAVISVFAWWNTKKYYNKVRNMVQLETFTSLEPYLNEIREMYESIDRMHNTETSRGKNLDKIPQTHLDISKNLHYIRKKIPSQFHNILSTINSAVKEIDSIKDNKSYNKRNSNFKELGDYIKNLEEGFKVEKEKLKGV